MHDKSLFNKVRKGLTYSMLAASIACGGNSPTAPTLPETTPAPTSRHPSIIIAADVAVPGLQGAMLNKKIIEQNPESPILIPGDTINVANGGTKELYESLFRPSWGAYLDRINPVPGNHDCEATIDGIFCKPYYDFFGAKSNPHKGYYSFDYGGAHFIALNSNIPVKSGSEQHTWLEKDLKTQSKLCTIAYFHHPLFSSSLAPGNVRSESNHVKSLVELLYKYHAELILNGHSHTYQRSLRINPDGTPDENGFVELISGTGGAELYELEPDSTEPAKKFAKRGKAHGMTKAYIIDGQKLDIEFIPAEGFAFTDNWSMLCR